MKKSLAAADRLAEEGISVEVVDPRSLAPLDVDTILKSVKKTGRLVLVDRRLAIPRLQWSSRVKWPSEGLSTCGRRSRW